MNDVQHFSQEHAAYFEDARSQLSPADLEIIHAVSTASSSHQCNDLFRSATKRFEVDKFACGEIDLRKRSRTVFFSMQWSESWRRFYLDNFLERDPLLRFIEEAKEPVTWGEWQASKRLTPDETAAFKLVGSHGWIDGFALPVSRSGSHIGLVSVVCKRKLDPAKDKVFLTNISFCYLERIRAVICANEFPVAPMGLTPRELECLGLVAIGLKDREIAKKLKLSISTAHEHIQRAMRRLEVTSRAEAVGLAVAFGALRI
jgi:LuxR family quorum sensing-dependent transcriptional regulator